MAPRGRRWLLHYTLPLITAVWIYPFSESAIWGMCWFFVVCIEHPLATPVWVPQISTARCYRHPVISLYRWRFSEKRSNLLVALRRRTFTLRPTPPTFPLRTGWLFGLLYCCIRLSHQDHFKLGTADLLLSAAKRNYCGKAPRVRRRAARSDYRIHQDISHSAKKDVK